MLRVCGIFHNEAPYLKEWITHHLVLGVSKIYLYDHSSDDGFMEEVQPFLDTGVAEIRHWNTAMDDSVNNMTIQVSEASAPNLDGKSTQPEVKLRTQRVPNSPLLTQRRR